VWRGVLAADIAIPSAFVAQVDLDFVSFAVSMAYNSSIVSYFRQKDLFSAFNFYFIMVLEIMQELFLKN
jgi:hypothetical protein